MATAIRWLNSSSAWATSSTYYYNGTAGGSSDAAIAHLQVMIRAYDDSSITIYLKAWATAGSGCYSPFWNGYLRVGTSSGGTQLLNYSTPSNGATTVEKTVTITTRTTVYVTCSIGSCSYSGGYQQWGKTLSYSKTITYSKPTFTISYNSNGGSGSMSNSTKTLGTSLTLSACTFTKASTTASTVTVTFNANGGSTSKTSQNATKTTTYSFNKWNTASDGSGTSYGNSTNMGAVSYTTEANATMYAQWSSSTSSSYSSVTLPTRSQCTRTDWYLLGFATSSTATSATYSPGASYTPTAAIILYAVWTPILKIYYNVNGGTITTGTGETRYRASSTGVVQRSTDSGSTWADYYTTMYGTDAVKDLVNVATFGITRTGYYITSTSAWRTGASSGNAISQESDEVTDTNPATFSRLIGNATLTAPQSITLYVYWQSYKITFYYNVNGGAITTGTGTTRYRVGSNGLIERSTDSGATWITYYHTMTNDDAYVNLVNISTFGAYKTGYQYEPTEAYSSAAAGGTKFNQDTTSTSDVNPTTIFRLTGNNILTANTTITLYIYWQVKPIGIWIYDGSSWHLYNQYVFNGVEWNSCIPAIYSGSVWDYSTQTT